MKRFRDILVLVPAGEEAGQVVARATKLASRNRARLTLFDVVPELSERQARVDYGQRTIDLQQLLVESRLQDIEELATKEPAADTRVAVAVGEPFLAVIERVVTHEHDLVIMAPDRAGRTSGFGGATTTLHLLRKCPVPVWVDDPSSWDRNDVLVAVGPFPADGDIGDLNRTLLELGSSLAALQGGQVHLVHAWRLEGETMFRRGRIRLPAEEVDALVRAERIAAEKTFGSAMDEVSRMGSVPVDHLRQGDASDVISSVVNEVRPGVVVMGTLARAGLRGVLIGNTAERMLDHVDASVIAVKPPGFVSPVVP